MEKKKVFSYYGKVLPTAIKPVLNMKNPHIKNVLFLLAFFLNMETLAAQQVDTLKENSAIRKLVKSYEDAWNRHDPVGLAASYRTDATGVNWFGAYYKGRQDIEDHYRTTHNTYFKLTHYYTRAVEDVQYLKSDIAIAHIRTGLTDDARYPGETFEFRRMIVLTKKDGLWLIQSGQNAKLERGVK